MIFLTFLFIITGLVVRNVHLAQILFYDWDEGIYAQVAQEIIKNKSLFTTFNDQVYLHVPPLIHSLIASVFILFGRSEFWARLIMVVIATALLILTYKAAKKIALILIPKIKPVPLYMVSFIPVFILAAFPMFVEQSTLINSDTLITVSWLGYILYRDSFWKKLFFLTIGVWTKSVFGFYPVLFDLIAWVIQKKQISFTNIKKYVVFLIVPSLWYVVSLIKYGNTFINQHLISQVLKRVTVPIELHFGGKFYYFTFLWEKIGLINILFIVSYILYGIYLIRSLIKYRLSFFKKNNLTLFIFMIVPLVFFIFLTLMKTKIYWYVIMFFPFISLSIVYLFAQLKNKFLQYILFIGITVYFLISFVSQTYLTKVSYVIPEKLKLAKCISEKPYKNFAFLVDTDERKVKNFLEAAHYDTSISFYWGGSPSFVFYAKKKVNYFYDIEEFIKQSNSNDILIASKKDVENNPGLKNLYADKKSICNNENWLSVVQY